MSKLFGFAAGASVAAMMVGGFVLSARADGLNRCLRFAQYQYPYDYNTMTPEQQQEERNRAYRDQYERNMEQYQKNQQEMQQRRRETYGAIAYSPDGGDYGFSFGYGSRAEAEKRAKSECGKTDCEIAAWFSNSCGALAVGDDGTWAGGNGNSERAARADAMSDCVKDGGKKCEVLISKCSR